MARLQIYDGHEQVQDVELGRETVTVGRDEDNAVVLEDASVSRRHALIEPTGNFYLVRDQSSTNGTFVNDLLVRVHLLSHGDVVRIGRYLLRVDARPALKESTRVRIETLELPGREMVAGGEAPPPEESSGASRREREKRLLERLSKLHDTIGYIDSREELQSRAVDYLLDELGGDRSSFLLLEGGGEDSPAEALRPVAARIRERPATAEPPEIRIDHGILEQVLERRRTLVFPIPERPAEGAAVAAPLIDGKEVRGVIYLDRAFRGGTFDEEEKRFFTLAVGHVAIGLSNARLFEEVCLERSKVQAILTSLTDGILVTDRRFAVTDANIGATVLLGLQDTNPLGETLFGLLENFRVTPRPELIAAEASLGTVAFHLQAGGRDQRPEEQRSLSGSIAPYPHGDPSGKGFVVTLRDATESRRVEQLKGEFINNVAHKLRTPLTVVEGDLAMLRENQDSTVLRQELLEEIERNTETLCRLVDRFVDFAEMELRAASDADVVTPTSLYRLIADVVRAREGEGVERRTAPRIRNRVSRDLPRVPARARRLRSAIETVVDNGLKFSSEGSEIDIDAELGDGVVKLHFVDQGPGIPPREIEAVFYVGHQVDPQQTGQVPGAGLGLSIARHIVQEHGGDIRIVSPAGPGKGGTRVSLVLPLGSEPWGIDAGDASGARQSEVQHVR